MKDRSFIDTALATLAAVILLTVGAMLATEPVIETVARALRLGL
ncbi:MAG: hypothetical protein RID91_22380 [Azospirillaceae bacterium]